MSDPAWWVTGEDLVLAGPFGTKADADMAGPPPGESWEDVEDLAAVYGTRLADGTIEQRPSPADMSWRAPSRQPAEPALRRAPPPARRRQPPR